MATRRLRAALRLLDGPALTRTRRRARRLQDALGRVRDLHVQLAWLGSPEATKLDARRLTAQARTARQRTLDLRPPAAGA